MKCVVVLGAQWGDEGKGKIVDLFADRFDIVTRYQGGHNAGHTVHVGDQKYILKLIPSGILRPGKLAVIGNGVVIDPRALLDEITTLEKVGVDVQRQLAISNRAHVIFPFHRLVERISEDSSERAAIGTTSRGIGPTYEDKIGRRGIRVADLIDKAGFPDLYRQLRKDKVALARAFGVTGEDLDVLEQYQEYAERLRPMVHDTTRLLGNALRDGKRILLEGAQGTMLDIDHGTYPFVTSSSAAAGGACTGTGIPPNRIGGIAGVSKAYITRVGAGPFPSEDHGPEGERIRKAGHEFGSVTGRPRRCGWFDVPLLRYTAMVNGFDSLILTKLDVLDELDEIPVCVAYELDGEVGEEMPAQQEALCRVKPVYEKLPGWKTPTFGATRFEALPANARSYIRYLEEKTGVEVGCVSTGPERNQTMVLSGSRLEAMFG
ncbi:MAG: adenylosuccinate synthase [Bryobacteraceae bacterium]